jgi:hypothetical protein
MKLIKALINHLKKPPEEGLTETPGGLCPNCWGRQEYGGRFYEAAKNYDADVDTKNPNVGWVQEYANKHLSGITLKHDNEDVVCNTCKVRYHPE